MKEDEEIGERGKEGWREGEGCMGPVVKVAIL
jgi:hypothetical protein